jgi:tetratricopeptide (TPR) repeat protein
MENVGVERLHAGSGVADVGAFEQASETGPEGEALILVSAEKVDFLADVAARGARGDPGDRFAARGPARRAREVRRRLFRAGALPGAGGVLNEMSQIYKARGEYETALNYLEQSLQICRELGDKGSEGTILNDISSIYYTKEDLDTALKIFEQSLRIYQEIGDKHGAGVILNNISQIYHAKGNYDTALGYLEESLRICQSNGDQSGMGAILNNISRIYQAWGDYNTALDYLNQSLQISRDTGDKREMISIYHNLAVVSLEQEEPQKYLEYALSGYSLALEIDDAVGIYNVGRILGRMLCKVGMKREGIPILQKCLSVGQAAHFPDVGEIKDLLHEYQNLQ